MRGDVVRGDIAEFFAIEGFIYIINNEDSILIVYNQLCSNFKGFKGDISITRNLILKTQSIE